MNHFKILFKLLFISVCSIVQLSAEQNEKIATLKTEAIGRPLAKREPVIAKYRHLIDEKKLVIPATIAKIHGPHEKGSQDHIHFKCGYTYNLDGTWDYDKGLNLCDETIIFIQHLGFPTPQKNEAYELESLDLEDKSPSEWTTAELEMVTGSPTLPVSVRAIHEPHGNGQQRHIHFVDDERSLNQDGTWESNEGRPLTAEEESFALKLGFTLPTK